MSGYAYDTKSNASESFVVQGFSTEQACRNAGNKILIPKSPIEHVRVNSSFSCVSKDV
ncbi:hypothetical protein D3C75_1341520 [compost metagenome]